MVTDLPIVLPLAVDLTPIQDWHYDQSGYYAYVLINGTFGQLTAARRQLSDAGLPVSIAGRSFRTADDGKIYDWYIRLGHTPSLPSDTYARLKALLGSAALGAEADLKRALQESDDRLAGTSRQLGAAREALREESIVRRRLEVQLDHIRREAEIRKLQSEALEDENRRLKEASDDLELRILELADALDGLRESSQSKLTALSADLDQQRQNSHERTRELERQLAQARERVSRLSEEKEQLETAWLEADERLESKAEQASRAELDLQNDRSIFEARLEQIESERNRLQAKVRELEVTSTNTSASQTEAELGSMLKVLLPQLILTDASVSFIRNELQDPLPLLHTLADLNRQPQDVRGKKVQGVKEGWFERHFNTGESDLGRLYYSNRGNRRYHVHIGHKDTQLEDIGELRAMNRELAAQRLTQR